MKSRGSNTQAKNSLNIKLLLIYCIAVVEDMVNILPVGSNNQKHEL